MKTALTIAGSDPTGGAGIQADLRTFAAMGVYGLSIPAALTAQNTTGVDTVFGVEADFIRRQIDTLRNDIEPDAVKIGMLYSASAVSVIANAGTRSPFRNLVIDPVTISSTGVRLIEEDAVDLMKERLFPQARVVTPNILEASLIAGVRIEGVDDMKKAAESIHAMGPESVIVTGGHLKEKAVDIMFDGDSYIELEVERVEGEFHGTGCVFSSAIAAGLALGMDTADAFRRAGEFVLNAIKNASYLGRGMKILMMNDRRYNGG
jgi:hydroxymethylpyrimidine/phosphomethylpyrimidine kinase